MGTNNVYLLLGSNCGDRLGFLTMGCKMISAGIGTILHQSSVYETEPWGFKAEVSFFNQAIMVETTIPAQLLLEKVLQIERSLGRIRNATGYESRCIDIDILFYGNEIIKTSGLTVPHPLIQERKFALMPLTEIAPEYVHPLLGLKISELLSICGDMGKVRMYREHP